LAFHSAAGEDTDIDGQIIIFGKREQALMIQLTNFMKLSSSWGANSSSATEQHPMQSGGSLPCLQKSFTRPCPEPEEFSPISHPVSLRSVLIVSFHLHFILLSVLFPSEFPTKICGPQFRN
jgi:hypothetical protein